MADAILDKKPGDEVEIEYFRGGDRKTVEVKLGQAARSARRRLAAAGRRGAAGQGLPFPLP